MAVLIALLTEPHPPYTRKRLLATKKPSSSTAEIRLRIEGMTCAACVRWVEKALERVEGVSVASVNLATEQVSITYDPDRVDVDSLNAAVNKAGYTATTTEAALASTSAPAASSPAEAQSLSTTLEIGGMTCAACVRRVEKALERVDGVSSASVNLATERAVVDHELQRVSVEDLAAAVRRAGDSAAIPESAPSQTAPPAASPSHDEHLTLGIDGMTCAACVRNVEAVLQKVDGVTSASVNFGTERELRHRA
jgi:P-type Cu+ transporter